MAFSNITLEEMMEKINFQRWTLFDFIIPAEYEGCPSPLETLPPREFKTAPTSPNDIPKNSDMWIQFLSTRYSGPEKIIARYNELNYRTGKNRAGEGIICTILENAFYHGNQNNPQLPVSIKVCEGTKGMIIRVRDSGVGFDFNNTIQTVEKLNEEDHFFAMHPDMLKGKERYFKRRGRGFAGYLWHPGAVSFENEGTTTNLMLLFDY